MDTESGRSPRGSGSRPTGRASKAVSPVPASIPSADDVLAELWFGFLHHSVADLSKAVATSGKSIAEIAAILSVKEDGLIKLLRGHVGPPGFRFLHNVARVAGFRPELSFSPMGNATLASAIEARRVETERLDAKHESAVGAAETPNTCGPTEGGA